MTTEELQSLAVVCAVVGAVAISLQTVTLALIAGVLFGRR